MANYLSFHLELNAALIRYAEVNLRRRKRWKTHSVIREIPSKNINSFSNRRFSWRCRPNR